MPRERFEDVAHHYELIGGRSPLNELTRRQAEGLREALGRAGLDLPVYVGMRNWHPFLAETLAEMKAAGQRRALGIILSSLQTEASWDRYVADVAAARDDVGAGAPEVVYAPAWAEHPLFIAAMVERLADALARVPLARRADTPVVFTAHSVPVAMAEGVAVRGAARSGRARASRRAFSIRAGPWRIRAGAGRRAIRGSSRTSATRSATWRAGGPGRGRGADRLRRRSRGGALRPRRRGARGGGRAGGGLSPGRSPPMIIPPSSRCSPTS